MADDEAICDAAQRPTMPLPRTPPSGAPQHDHLGTSMPSAGVHPIYPAAAWDRDRPTGCSKRTARARPAPSCCARSFGASNARHRLCVPEHPGALTGMLALRWQDESAAGSSVTATVALTFLAVNVLVSARITESRTHTAIPTVIIVFAAIVPAITATIINAYAPGPEVYSLRETRSVDEQQRPQRRTGKQDVPHSSLPYPRTGRVKALASRRFHAPGPEGGTLRTSGGPTCTCRTRSLSPSSFLAAKAVDQPSCPIPPLEEEPPGKTSA